MPLNLKSAGQNSDFEETMAQLNDEQLVDVLKKRSLYQPEAARQAIREAIGRGIIQSEDDLADPGFSEKKLRRQLFPEIENEKIRNKVSKSIARGFILAGLLPAILGAVRLSAGNRVGGISLLIFAVAWIGVSFMIFRRFSIAGFYLLAGLLILSVVYMAIHLFSLTVYGVMDYFIVVMLFVLILYGLIYLKRLNT